jgi:hypothetical protein
VHFEIQENPSDVYMQHQCDELYVFDDTDFEDETFVRQSSRQSPISVARTSMVRLWQST